MYKHTNKGEGTITFSDDSGNHHVFFPGSTIALDKPYPRAEAYQIFCIDAEQKVINEEKPTRKNKKKIEEMIEDDGTNN